VTTRCARIPPRRRFFLGCQGESEQSYGALLQIIADEPLQLCVHLDLQLLGGGDPLAIVEAAVEKARERARNRGRFVHRAVLLDSDRHGYAPERDNRIAPLAQANGLLLIWQRPCHEALLLRHLPGCQTLRPSSSAAAEPLLYDNGRNTRNRCRPVAWQRNSAFPRSKQQLELKTIFAVFFHCLGSRSANQGHLRPAKSGWRPSGGSQGSGQCPRTSLLRPGARYSSKIVVVGATW
jgi:hypothetical protein